MFSQSIRTFIFAVALTGAAVSVSRGQDLQQEAVAMWEMEDYGGALKAFRNLMDREPENGMHRYYAGRCLLEINRDMEDAIQWLYQASRRNVPADVYYHLALAYYRNYHFSEAEKYFKRFRSEASRQEEKEFPVDRLLDGCRTAGSLTATYNPFNVINVTFLDLGDSVQYSQVKMKGGELQHKPAVFINNKDQEDELTRLMFIPKNPAKGSYVYFAGFSRNQKNGTQLFRAKRVAGKTWSDPEEIKLLNSDGDELLPYFDPIEDDLYFASNGREGIGGFDLYRSHYDRERDQWSEPINLGFPVNSVMDDYLLLPGSDLGMVMFFSNREGTDSTVTVYRVHLAEPKRKTVPGDFETLKEIAHLGGVASDILAELEHLETEDEDPGEQEVDMTEPAGERVLKQEKQKVQDPAEPAESRLILAEALGHQAVSDSLKDLAAAARARVRESEDPNERWVWQKQIMLWEKKAADEQEMADLLFAQMQMAEPEARSKPAVQVPETIEPDRKVGDMTVYRYADPPEGSSGKGTSAGSADVTRTVVRPVFSRFEILASSPYNEQNPIPMDIRLPEGTLYRIQLGAFGSKVDPDAFGGMVPITGEYIPERGLYKYYTGKFSTYTDASRALSRVQSGGYEDAFIVAWYGGKPVSTQRAKQLE